MLKGGFRIESEGETDTGRVRELNEDSLLLAPEVGLWVVADGMGGHDAGDFASQTLVEELGRDGGQAQERAVDVQITRLRRKIESDPKQPRYLQTVRGEGYMLAPD